LNIIKKKKKHYLEIPPIS